MKEEFNTSHSNPSSPAIHLAGDEIHLWNASLVQPAAVIAHFATLLSADEKTRAGRFYFEKDRARYIVGRGLLRKILGAYLGLDPAWIEFSYGSYGKPALKVGDLNHTLEFNLAHSADRVLYAFCWNRALGVDLEHIRPMENQDDFAAQIFAPSESTLITSLDGEQKQRTFFTIWTCKEAFFKASGDGLTKPIADAEIVVDVGGTASLLSIAGDPQQASGWCLETFQPATDYQAALAFRGEACKISFQKAEDYFA